MQRGLVGVLVTRLEKEQDRETALISVGHGRIDAFDCAISRIRYRVPQISFSYFSKVRIGRRLVEIGALIEICDQSLMSRLPSDQLTRNLS